MMQSMDDATEEMKRVEHQIDVSLKYTRTVDVIMNIIQRMIDGYEFMFDAVLKYARENNLIDEIPTAPVVKAQTVQYVFKKDMLRESAKQFESRFDMNIDEFIADNVELFLLLRKLSRSNPEREQEYRRHVTMRTMIDGREEIVNIDIITDYYNLAKNFMDFLYLLFEKFGKMKE